jgi:hypothetical protein
MRIPLIPLALLALVSLPDAALAQARLVRKTVSVEVTPATEADADAAAQVRKIAVETFENYRNMLARRYLADKDLKAQDELSQSVGEAVRKVQTGMRSEVFDQGFEELNQAYLRAKSLLGELDAALVASIYRGLFMGQVTMGDQALAYDYLLVLRNVSPDITRQAVSYTESFTRVFDKTEDARKAAGTRKVTVVAEPAGALIGVDGQVWGKSPLTVDAALGGHLVQVEMDGYYRGGWIRDTSLHGTEWKVELKAIESRSRYLSTLERLTRALAPAPAVPPTGPKPKGKKPKEPEPPPADPTALMLSLHRLLGSDYLLFAVVSSTGSAITVKGGFVTALGVVPVDVTVARDLTVIDSVRKVVLDASDVEKQKQDVAAAEKRKAAETVTGGMKAMLTDMQSCRSELMTRSRKWAMVGEPAKAELFATTAADISVMLEQARRVDADAAADPVAAARQVNELQGRWDPLRTKVRSLLAWDVDGAIHARKVAEAKAIAESAGTRLADVRKLAEEKKAKIDPAEAKQLARTFKDADKWLADAARLTRKDPLDPAARILHFRTLILAGELERKLNLKQ